MSGEDTVPRDGVVLPTKGGEYLGLFQMVKLGNLPNYCKIFLRFLLKDMTFKNLTFFTVLWKLFIGFRWMGLVEIFKPSFPDFIGKLGLKSVWVLDSFGGG
jgi:hypothetical protein